MKLKGIAIAALLSLTAVACSSHKTEEKTAKAEEPTKTSVAVQEVADNNGAYYAVLKFDKGTQRLSEASKKDLRDFVASAQREGRKIDEIKILAWADREYPSTGVRLTDRDVKIATQRSKSIEKYLKDDLNTSGDYETYNMAKRPNKVSEFFKGDDYKTKRIFERTGAAPAGTDMQAFMNSKASKALIMVDYKDE
ncbi:hypothetical protein SHI21_05915 [Bacteriovorax sp. PP10]|uniref:OmpA-like domain-containing protein n=1 Tax=Bacteriovorax antarcticus TaxID=3088717 RepID=A0ABU5VTN2_9BACT|nr:hypothetical protein [Bacteriovorax sp. PP10]MEA9355724.1 hypothetical protein [Bacteriovorax sp. PP10]